jgi:hypothetical protein
MLRLQREDGASTATESSIPVGRLVALQQPPQPTPDPLRRRDQSTCCVLMVTDPGAGGGGQVIAEQ